MSKIPYLKEELEQLCKDSYSYNEILVKTNRTKAGKNREILKKYIQLYNIDISHFTHSTNSQKYKTNEFKEEVVCQQCKCVKNAYTDFYWSNGKRVRSICKECVRANERNKYAERTQELNKYKETLTCKKCGENRSYLLDFHHKDPNKKDFTISDKITKMSLSEMKKEIDKCDVLCANCHREWHYLHHHLDINYDDWINK